MKDLLARGTVWRIVDSEGRAIDNIDTDMIFHNSHLHITEVDKMGEHAFGNLDAWQDFPKKVRDGDIIFAGKNFGAGSSRQQAVDCFAALGVSVIVAESFGAIYKRNAINSGMAIMEAPGIMEATAEFVDTGATVEFETGLITWASGSFQGRAMSKVQKDIFLAGSLFAYGKELANA